MNIPYGQQHWFLTPDQAMQLMQEGKRRFISNLRVNRNHPDLINVRQIYRRLLLPCLVKMICVFVLNLILTLERIIVAGAMDYVETGETEFFIPDQIKIAFNEKIYSNA